MLAAAREVFGARGFDGATLAAIAAKVGLSPAALLRHAPTKQELFEAAFAGDRGEIRLPIEFLAGVDAAAADPAKVLRRVAEALVPFLERIVGETVALWLRSNALAVEDPGRLPLLFDRARRPTPPQRALVLIENYLRRAARARRLRVKDPRAAAIGLLGALHSYVLLHRVARAIDPPLALGRYLDTVIDVWLAGLAARGPKERS